jgi:cell fate (sporulation/competence/biofilm development) regulator YlbF (YheA/YmcA/DUF963 family)
MTNYQELQEKLDELYMNAPTREQIVKINAIKKEYQEKAQALVVSYMQKEIDALTALIK